VGAIHHIILLQILLGGEPHFIGLLASQPIGPTHLTLKLSAPVGVNEALKTLNVLLSRQPSFYLRNINTQTISDAGRADTMNMKLRHQIYLLIQGQRALAGIAHRWVGSSTVRAQHRFTLFTY
jgi:hypothetical protein